MSRDRARVGASIAYLVLMTFWIYAVVDHGLDVPEAPTWVVLIVAQVALGFLVRWWALLLPPVTVLLSLPAGYSDAFPSGELPIWFGALVLAVPAMALVLVGAVGRALYEWRRADGPVRLAQ